MRDRAGSKVRARVRRELGAGDRADPGQFERVVHELGVHQVELEMQNEQLLQTQAALEAARDRYRDLYEHAPSGYVSTDAEGRIVQANGRAAALLGLPPQRLLKRPLAEFVAPAARPRLQLWMRQLLREGGVRSLELPLRKPDGGSRWIAIEMLLAAEGPQGEPQCRLALMDVSERVELRQGMAQLAAIVSSSDDAIVGRDRLGRVTSWNAGAQRLFGSGAAEMIGRTMEALVPPERQDEEAELLRRLRRAEKPPHVETERLHADGRRLAVAMSLSPILGEDGSVVGSALIARDIGERKRAEQTLHHRLRQLDLLSQVGQSLILGEGGPAQIQHELFDRVRLAVGAEIWLRYTAEEPTGTLRLDDSSGLSEAQRGTLAELPPDGSLAGLALRHGVPVIVEDLLDVSRITRNRIELRRDRIDLMSAVEQAQEATRPLIEQQSHRLMVEPPSAPVLVFADLTRLTQVFANLLNNAAKYTDSGGLIELRVQRENDWAVVTVRDNGIGIAADQLPRVFDMFAQLKPALERSRGGLGIGLSLAHGLVALHGGRIEARSEGPGRGSEFIVRLPLLHAGDTAPAAAARPQAPPTLMRHRLLVVDDNDDAAQTLAHMLSLHGQEVRTAQGGPAALELAQTWRPDTAVIDIGMPGMNGYELCRSIREQPWGEHMLLIACTGWGQERDRQRASAAGFDAHFVKPVDGDALLRLLAGQRDAG